MPRPRTTPLLQGLPTLVIGKQRLTGRWVKLKKPLAVTEQVACTDKFAQDGDREYTLVGVIREKLVFDQRPDPIITRQVTPAGNSKRVRLEEPGSAVADAATAEPAADTLMPDAQAVPCA